MGGIALERGLGLTVCKKDIPIGTLKKIERLTGIKLR